MSEIESSKHTRRGERGEGVRSGMAAGHDAGHSVSRAEHGNSVIRGGAEVGFFSFFSIFLMFSLSLMWKWEKLASKREKQELYVLQ